MLKAIVSRVISGILNTATTSADTDYIEVQSAAGVTAKITKANFFKSIGGLSNSPIVVSLLNGGIKNLYTDNFNGWGTIQAGDDEAFAIFSFTKAGVVTIQGTPVNCSTDPDNAGTLNIYDNGTGVSVKNNLGATKNIRYRLEFSA